jgi:hypothetical protein
LLMIVMLHSSIGFQNRCSSSRWRTRTFGSPAEMGAGFSAMHRTIWPPSSRSQPSCRSDCSVPKAARFREIVGCPRTSSYVDVVFEYARTVVAARQAPQFRDVVRIGQAADVETRSPSTGMPNLKPKERNSNERPDADFRDPRR